MKKRLPTYDAIVLGTSAGGSVVIRKLVGSLPADFSIPIIIVQHVPEDSDGQWIQMLDERLVIRVKEADEKERIEAGTVYVAPANYHLLLEVDLTLTLTVDERVNFARPSIDILFETAAESCGRKLIGIVCTGSNSDGARGLLRIKQRGGLTIVQDPKTAESKPMPDSAIKITNPDHILPVDGIIEFLLNIHNMSNTHESEA